MERRDFEKHPYTSDEIRVCQLIQKIAPDFGCGDDPIGFMITTYEVMVHQRRALLRVLGVVQA